MEPLGFSISDRMLKRTGLDYRDHLNVEVHKSLNAFMDRYGELHFMRLCGRMGFRG